MNQIDYSASFAILLGATVCIATIAVVRNLLLLGIRRIADALEAKKGAKP